MHPKIEKLSKLLASLPSLGPRSARRIGLSLVKNYQTLTKELIKLLSSLESIKECKICNNLSSEEICNICSDSAKDQNQICIVNSILNLWAIERTAQFEGIFFVIEDEHLNLHANEIDPKLINLIERDNEHKEIIIAMNSTIEGQATSNYLQSILKKYDHLTITTLPHGLPMGSDLDYLDQSTLTIALSSRKEL